MAGKVCPALDFIFALLQDLGKSPADAETLQFCNALTRFQRYLRTAVSNKSVFKFARSRQVAESYHVIYATLDRLLDVMGVSGADRSAHGGGLDRIVARKIRRSTDGITKVSTVRARCRT